jgi:hypothetical protein
MKNRLHIYITYIVLISFLVAGISLSRFETTMTGSGIAVVGRPVIDCVPISAELNGEPVAAESGGIDIGGLNPGDEFVYRFSVSNFKDGVSNEVLLKYKVSISFDPDPLTIPFECTIMPDGSYPSAGGGWTLMGFGQGETHSYTLTVRWDESQTDPVYLNRQQSLRLKIDAEQTVSGGD